MSIQTIILLIINQIKINQLRHGNGVCWYAIHAKLGLDCLATARFLVFFICGRLSIGIVLAWWTMAWTSSSSRITACNTGQDVRIDSLGFQGLGYLSFDFGQLTGIKSIGSEQKASIGDLSNILL